MDAECISDYTKFVSQAFLNQYYSELGLHPLFGEFWINEMKWLHEAFATNNIKGRQLLDIGTGPTIHSVISASAHVDNIFLSDFAPQNRDTLKHWLDGTLEHNFGSYFKFVVEKEGTGESPSAREMMLRKKVSGILNIDLQQEYPLAPSFFPQFDIITTTLCLVSVAQDHGMYERMATRTADLLRADGHVLLFSQTGANSYQVGDYWFKSLNISGEKVREIWKKCGLEIIDWKQESVMVAGNLMVYYLMVAKKSRR